MAILKLYRAVMPMYLYGKQYTEFKEKFECLLKEYAEIINYLNTNINDYSNETRNSIMNFMMKQFIDIRKNIYTDELFDHTLVEYIQYLNEIDYKTLLKHMFEFIYYYFEQKMKGEDVKTNP